MCRASARIPGPVSVVVSNNGDSGALVKAREAGVQAVPVLRDDSVDDLKARVQAREKEFVVETLARIAAGDIRLAAGAG